MFESFIWVVERILVFTQLDKLLCFPATPSVNRLFWIAHNHQSSFYTKIILTRKRIINERNQVLPLHFGSILKFVNKKMTVAFAQSFIYKRSRLVLDFPMNNRIKFRDRKYILFFLNFG